MGIIAEITKSGVGYREAFTYLNGMGKKCKVDASWTWDAKRFNNYDNFIKYYRRFSMQEYPDIENMCAGYSNKNKFVCYNNGARSIGKLLDFMTKKKPIVIARLQPKRKHLDVVIYYNR